MRYVHTGPFVTEMQVLEGAFGPRGLGAVGEPLGPATELRFPSTGVAVVPALWAQRAVNAWRAARGSSVRIATDGIAGQQTLGALRAIRLQWLAEQPLPVSTSPRVVTMPAIVDRHHVSMAGDLYAALARLTQVDDTTPSSPPVETDPELAPAPSAGASGGVVLAVALGLGAAMWFGRRR